jgi:hypothetical protein
MNDKPKDNKLDDGRKIFVWRGRDLDEDTNRMAEAIAESGVAELFAHNGGLIWFHDGQPVPAIRPILPGIIARFIKGTRLVRCGATWKREDFTFDFPVGADTGKEPNDKVLTGLTEALLWRVAKGPQEPVHLSAQQQVEIRQRLAMGEPRDRIASAYKIDLGTVRALAGGG